MKEKSRILYTFTVNKPETVDEVEVTKNDKGEEVKVVTKKENSVPKTFHILKQTRQNIDAAELFYGVKFHEGIRHGLMPKSSLLKFYSQNGESFSEQKQKFVKLQGELLQVQTSIQQALRKEGRTEEDEKVLNEAYEKFGLIQLELREYEAAEASFAHTAEEWAKNKTVIWWVMSLAHKEENGEIKPFFEGATTDERLKCSDTIEESGTEFDKDVMKKFLFLISFWYAGRASTPEEFNKILESL